MPAKTPEELIAAARAAKADLDAAASKAEVVAAFQKHMGQVGWKVLGRLLTGQAPEKAVERWAKRLGSVDDQP